MKILFIAMADSIHTAKWISQIADLHWETHLFPCIDNAVVHRDIKNTTIYHSIYEMTQACDKSVKRAGLPLPNREAAILGRKMLEKSIPRYRSIQLKKVIKKLKPDIIHSIEIQHAGYLTLEAKKYFGKSFPPWIVTNLGSDIYLFGRIPEHKVKIKEVLASCDYYSCECKRDVCLAKEYGYKGVIFPVFPNTGGFDLKIAAQQRSPGKTSNRRFIMLKGYQGWSGRALVGLRALERCAELLSGYQIVIYSASSDVEIAAKLFSDSTGLPVELIPKNTPNTDILKLHGRARISLGLSISDAISTSLLEAIVMGSFPIQSWTACADEWIEDGENGLLVPPEDPEIVEIAIRRALTEDELVNSAAEINFRLAQERLDFINLKIEAKKMYNTVTKEKRIKK